MPLDGRLVASEDDDAGQDLLFIIPRLAFAADLFLSVENNSADALVFQPTSGGQAGRACANDAYWFFVMMRVAGWGREDQRRKRDQGYEERPHGRERVDGGLDARGQLGEGMRKDGAPVPAAYI